MIDYNKTHTIKELCSTLNFKYNSHNPKRSLKEVEREYNIEHIGNKYRIVKELSEDEKIKNWRVTEYRKLFQDVVYTVLACSENNTIWKSDDDYMLIFHMVNENFKAFSNIYISKKREEFLMSHDKDMQFEQDALNFANEVRTMLKSVLNETFKKMEDENLINVVKHMMIGEFKYFINEKGQRVTYSKKRLASNDDIEMIMAEETRIIQKYKFKDINKLKDVRDYKTRKMLRNEVSENLHIAYYYEEKEIILNRYGLNYKVEHDETLRTLKSHLNKGTINKVLNSKQGKLKEIGQYQKEELTQLLIEIKENPQ